METQRPQDLKKGSSGNLPAEKPANRIIIRDEYTISFQRIGTVYFLKTRDL
jgi:hypothetical protein